VIGAIAKALKPVYAPLLKISLAPPHLPEGGTVRTLKPSEGHLTYTYLMMCLVAISHLYPATIVTIGAAVGLSHIHHGEWAILVGVIAYGISAAILGLQLVVARLDWELKHYVIGERSLRVREGAWVNREVTLSYANVQNVEVVQGPVERLFGFQSLKVTTAGGGGGGPKEQAMVGHGAVLVGLTNAEEIRQLILERMKTSKDSGLGDLDEAHRAAAAKTALPVEALREVLEAARELRAAMERARG
jgi:membrane protein YdbS with pleckstrin-like domain